MSTSFNNGVVTIPPFEPEDISSFFSAVHSSANDLGRWMPWCHAEYSTDEAKAWLATCQAEWAQGTSYPFLIVELNTHEVLGSVDINQVNRGHNYGNIGYWVASSRTGRGIATAAVNMVSHLVLPRQASCGSKSSRSPKIQQVGTSLRKLVLNLSASRATVLLGGVNHIMPQFIHSSQPTLQAKTLLAGK